MRVILRLLENHARRVTAFHGIRPGIYWVVRIDESGAPVGKPMPLAIVEDEDVELTWEEG